MTAADQAIAFARAQIGKPYQFGATGPNAYDCSGLVYAAYKSAGVSLGRTTYQQIFNGTSVSKESLAPGDLVFPDPGHVQIYVGGGQIIEAPHTGAFVRQVDMWGFWAARRVSQPGSAIALTSATGASLTGVPNLGDISGLRDLLFNAQQQINQLTAAMQGILNLLSQGAKLTGFLANPKNWYRIAIFLLGTILLLVALEQFSKIPSTVAKGAVSVAKSGASGTG